MSSTIYVEGGGSSAADRECRAGFRRLLERCGFQGRLPRMFPSGSRSSAYQDFRDHVTRSDRQEFVGLLVDSETRVADIDRTWDHLTNRSGDRWSKPRGTTDEQVLFMTTSMETWIVADLEALQKRFGQKLNEDQLPPLVELESRSRNDVYRRLRRATSNGYSKGRVSFELLGALDPDVLDQHLPSFRRTRRVLGENLES